MSLAGHYWTVASPLTHALVRRAAHPSTRWQVHVEDPRAGRVRLGGLLRIVPGARGLVVIIHGLGGRPTSHYCARAAAMAEASGLSSLRFGMRGTDHLSEDFGHAGLVEDLDVALASAELQAHERLYVLGYSIGGHVALRFAASAHEPKLRAAAAICAPLDLMVSADAFDRRIAWPYRRHVLRGLKRIYRDIAARREVPTPPSVVDRVRTIRELDHLTVVPRHGFASVDDYYRRESVAPRLGDLRVPSLLVAAEGDPMVPAATLRHALNGSAALRVVWTPRGGHVSFPGDLDLGLAGRAGLEAQVMGWLMEQ